VPRFVYPYIQKSAECLPSTRKSYKNLELSVRSNGRFLELEIVSKLHKKIKWKKGNLPSMSQRGSGSLVLLIINLGTERWCVVKFTLWPLRPWQRTPVLIFKRLSVHHTPSGGFGEGNTILPQPAVEHRPAQPGA
jgi:hypothetical protein